MGFIIHTPLHMLRRLVQFDAYSVDRLLNNTPQHMLRRLVRRDAHFVDGLYNQYPTTHAATSRTGMMPTLWMGFIINTPLHILRRLVQSC